MSSGTFYVIATDNVTPATREQIHEVLTEHSEDWWHHFADLWIVVGTKKASEWRELVSPFTKAAGGAVLVLALPRQRPRSWAYSGLPADAAQWLRDTYTPPDP